MLELIDWEQCYVGNLHIADTRMELTLIIIRAKLKERIIYYS